MNNEFNKVKEFHKAFNHPYSDTPVSMKLERAKVRSFFFLY